MTMRLEVVVVIDRQLPCALAVSKTRIREQPHSDRYDGRLEHFPTAAATIGPLMPARVSRPAVFSLYRSLLRQTLRLPDSYLR